MSTDGIEVPQAVGVPNSGFDLVDIGVMAVLEWWSQSKIVIAGLDPRLSGTVWASPAFEG
ncbi:hypothetical protein [Telmatospirillum siberiense]|uniref:hypothetical protein n=1 Tax=Telmatospirillum siberiense TaxID=382514 RepID=UPI0011AF8690|nr:hypothetical protein [Telmatospirillum siberiense]